jgi:hypothetical protein
MRVVSAVSAVRIAEWGFALGVRLVLIGLIVNLY